MSHVARKKKTVTFLMFVMSALHFVCITAMYYINTLLFDWRKRKNNYMFLLDIQHVDISMRKLVCIISLLNSSIKQVRKLQKDSKVCVNVRNAGYSLLL